MSWVKGDENMAKFEVRFDGNVCKGCELCSFFCPKKIISMSPHINNRGYSPAMVEEMDKCSGCKSCTLVCPEGAISLYKEVAAQ